MAKHKGKETIYKVVDDFTQLCLSNNLSLLWPKREVWTVSNLANLRAALIDSPDESSDTFFEKLQRQISQESEDVHRLAADLYAFYSLYTDWVKPETKLKDVNQIIEWKLNSDTPEYTNVLNAFESGGISPPGRWYINKKEVILGYFINVFVEAKNASINLSILDQFRPAEGSK